MSTARINFFWLIIFGATLPLGVVLSTHLARRSFEKVKLRDQTITVKGFAEQRITSDLAMWSAGIAVRDADRTAGYKALERDRALLLAYLGKHGFDADAVSFSPVGISTIYKLDEDGDRTNEIELYSVSQGFAIESDDVQLIAKFAKESSALIADGVDLSATSPSYLYTKLDEMKLEMISKATANARERAERLVDGSGNGLGPLRSASQGVFQITPAYSTEVASYGYNDTTSIDKSIKAVVTVEYAIQ